LKGNKPDFHQAMEAEQARQLFDLYTGMLRSRYLPEKVQTGKFQAKMEVGSIINGPVTIQH
jgi:D-tyrosyl-tRNA(Tyr) deacylase